MNKIFKIIYLQLIILFYLNNIKLETEEEIITTTVRTCESNPCLVRHLI